MRHRIGLLLFLLVAIAVVLPPAAAQDDDAVLRLLSYVPADGEYREWLTFGDIEAWHTSWDVPRPDSVEQLDQWDALMRAQWLVILPRQTTPPDTLGLNTLLSDDMRGFYGFDFFDVERVLVAGEPPNMVTLAEHHANPAVIGAALHIAGYEAESLADGWTLYSLGEDYAMPGPNTPGMPRPGMLGQLNRIALKDNLMIIARGTPAVLATLATLAAQQDGAPSLVDEPFYAAVVETLASVAPADAGDLVGALFVPGAQFGFDPAQSVMGQAASPGQIHDLRAWLDDPANQLPLFPLVAFGTHHAPGATYLTLALALLPGEDAEAVAAKVAGRMEGYVSLRTRQPLNDRWTLENAGTLEAAGLPVAWVTMRVDDPPPAAEGEPPRTGVLSWMELVTARDVGFLMSGAPVE